MISGDLGTQLERFVQHRVVAGHYHSKCEVLREGVHFIQDRETKLVALDAAVAEALEDVEAGRMNPAKEVFTQLRARYRIATLEARLRVKPARRAQTARGSIAAYTAGNNPSRAMTFVVGLYGKCMTLADIPAAFPLIPRYGDLVRYTGA